MRARRRREPMTRRRLTPPRGARAHRRRDGPGPAARASPLRAAPTSRTRARAEAARCRAEESPAAGSFEQVADAAGGEPARAVAVHPAAFAADDEAAQSQGHEQQPPGALGVGDSAVLAQEAQLAAQVLDEQAPLVARRVDVRRLGAGEEQELPARLDEAVGPVGLLAEEEERVVG